MIGFGVLLSVGWAPIALLMVQNKKGCCSLNDWGGIMIQKLPKEIWEKTSISDFGDNFKLKRCADIRVETRCASGVWQRLLLAAVIRAAWRSW
jgi:hypothetical protein